MKELVDKGFILTGSYDGPMASSDICLIRAGATGELKWGRDYQWPGAGEFETPCGTGIVETPDHGYMIAGLLVIMRTDSAGDSLWTRPITSWDVEPTPDGGYISAWDSLVKIDASGNELWSRAPSDPNTGYGWVGVLPDGSFIAAGGSYTDSLDLAVLAKFSPDGSLMWERSFNGISGVDATGLSLTSDGGCYVIGITYDDSHSWSDDYGYLLRTDASGNMMWQRELFVLSDPWEDITVYPCCSGVTPARDGGCVIAGCNADSGATLVKVGAQGDVPAYCPSPRTSAGLSRSPVRTRPALRTHRLHRASRGFRTLRGVIAGH